MDYYNSGVSSESSYFLTKYIYNKENINFHIKPLFQENNSKILSMGFVYKFNNHYINLGKVHPINTKNIVILLLIIHCHFIKLNLVMMRKYLVQFFILIILLL